MEVLLAAQKELRKLKQGERLTAEELNRIKRLMETNPGLTGEKYKKLIEWELGIQTTVGTVYNWMERVGIKTSRDYLRYVSVVGEQENIKLERLLRLIRVPLAEELSDGRDLARSGIDEIGSGSGKVRLYWEEDGGEFRCWFTPREAAFVEEILERMDRMTKTGFSSELALLQQETADYIRLGTSYNYAASEFDDRRDIGSWKLMRESGQGSPLASAPETEAERLLKKGRTLRGRARKLVSDIRMMAG